jgi:RNA polymerase sigma-70 factor (ECF subfamily)
MTAVAAARDAAAARESGADLEPYRRQLTGYCYRMLGSAFDAEDAVQETMLRAWRGRDGFDGRAPFEAWLYRIATNVCLNLIRGRQRRAHPMDLGPASPADATLGAALPEGTWIGPVADGRVLAADDPAELAVEQETVRLAFVAALQHLPPRQRAVLILRDVLRWRAKEVAALLETTEVSVKSAHQRARTTLASRAPGSQAAPQPDEAQNDDQQHRELLARYMEAFNRYDVDELVTLLHEDATIAMPPHAFWLQGRSDIAHWLRQAHHGCSGSVMVPIRANGSPALAQYRPTGPGGRHEPFAISLFDITGDRISAVHAFLDQRLFPLFDLPT